jgi:two-component system nitrate/nitrite response regulator NarL
MVSAVRTGQHRGVATEVLIVDDDPRFRAAAVRIVRAAGLDVAGEAADGASALAAVAALEPDGVLLDVGLPDLDGFAVARRIAAGATAARVLLTSADAGAVPARVLAECGAVGFVPKTALPSCDLRGYLAG